MLYTKVIQYNKVLRYYLEVKVNLKVTLKLSDIKCTFMKVSKEQVKLIYTNI